MQSLVAPVPQTDVPGNSECVGGSVADLLNSKRKGVLNPGGKR
jgi:hypothetical protein